MREWGERPGGGEGREEVAEDLGRGRGGVAWEADLFRGNLDFLFCCWFC